MFSYAASTMGEATAESQDGQLESYFKALQLDSPKLPESKTILFSLSCKKLLDTEVSAWVNPGIGLLDIDKK